MKPKRIKVNVTLPEDVLTACDEYAQANAMTRSGLVAIAVRQYVQAQKTMPNLNNAFALLGSLSKRAVMQGGVDSAEYQDELKQLEDMQGKLFMSGSAE